MPQFVPDVEAVMEAFRTSLQSLITDQTVKTLTRIWIPWDDLKDILQPAVVIVEPWEMEEATIGKKSKITLTTQLVCYLQTDRADLISTPAKKVNDLIRAIRNVIIPNGSDIVRNTNTLGGLAAGVFVNGKIVKDAGVLDNQASILIPVSIILP
jgi:hypothetical protein